MKKLINESEAIAIMVSVVIVVYLILSIGKTPALRYRSGKSSIEYGSDICVFLKKKVLKIEAFELLRL